MEIYGNRMETYIFGIIKTCSQRLPWCFMAIDKASKAEADRESGDHGCYIKNQDSKKLKWKQERRNY